MDRDESHLGYYDYNPELEDIDRCIYCGEELGQMNVVHYEFNPETYETKVLAINPMPHDKIVVRKGFVRRTEMVCDACINEETPYGTEGH